MTVEEYQQFLEYISTIDVLDGIDDFAPDWKPLTKEEYHERYISKIKVGITEGKITQDAYDFWEKDNVGELDHDEHAVAMNAMFNINAKIHPEFAENTRMIQAAIDAAQKSDKDQIYVDFRDDSGGGTILGFTI